jgi:hypothetical protein
MLISMFFATLQWKPFEALHVGRLEIISLFVSFMTLWMGSFFWASDNVELAVSASVFIVIINIVFILYLLITLISDTCHDYKIVQRVKRLSHMCRFSMSSSKDSSKGKGSLEMVNFETNVYENPMEENRAKETLQKEMRRKKMQKVRKKLSIGARNARRLSKVACGEEGGDKEIHINVNAGKKEETREVELFNM